MSTGDKTSGGEGGIRTPDTGVSPYNGLAIAHQFALRNVLKGLQSGSEALIRGESFSIGTKCSLFCSPMLVNRPVGWNTSEAPVRRRLGRAEIEKIRLLRFAGQKRATAG